EPAHRGQDSTNRRLDIDAASHKYGFAPRRTRYMADAVAADKPRFIVVGGGLAGLMTVIKIAEAGYHVDVFSFVPCRRSHSVCAQGGINGAVNTKGEGDSPEIHFIDSVKGGDFLAHQPPLKAMCYAAPGVIYLLDRMGVPF